MKKALYIFFCVYFIALAVKPCADKVDCNEFKQTEMSHDDHQKEHSDEVCTPFCVCACCAANALVKDYSPALAQLNVVNTVYKTQRDSKISSIIISIWQPPKIA